MTPKQAKAEADDLIARANRIAKAKLDAAGEECARTKKLTVAANKAKSKLPYCHAHKRALNEGPCPFCAELDLALKGAEGIGV